jgi:hypothetical protein
MPAATITEINAFTPAAWHGQGDGDPFQGTGTIRQSRGGWLMAETSK